MFYEAEPLFSGVGKGVANLSRLAVELCERGAPPWSGPSKASYTKFPTDPATRKRSSR